jgi:hypothetical protein
MPKQFCYRPQIHSGHNKFTGKRMAIAMPGVSPSPVLSDHLPEFRRKKGI